jgi:DNA primase
MRYPPAILDDIRARLPVSAVVGRTVPLKRQGREFAGLSPFKSERTPSFFVNDQKGFFHCFASGEHGDIFSFLMKTEGISFFEAVQRLAGEAGVTLPKESPEAARQEDAREKLIAIMEEAARFFEANLAGPRGRETREYLAKRGVTPEEAKRFRMGFAPDARGALKEYLAARGVSIRDMIETGLLVAGDDIPTPYDRFRGRLIIPITDLRDKVIAFGGRALAPDAKPKYLNSPETPLFHKGGQLFNGFRARKAAHDSGQIVVVEGYMDVVAMVRGGVEHAVAPLGTALTESQLGLLWRMSPEPTICLDGDAAGQKAALRAADLALPHIQPGRSLRFAFMPDGLDPDDLIRQRGPEALRKALEQTQPLIEVLWRRERDAEPLDTPERKAGLERRLTVLAKRIADPAVSGEYMRELRQRSREYLWQQRSGGSARASRGAAAAGARPKSEDWRIREQAGLRGNKGKPAFVPPRPQAREELLRSALTRQHADAGLNREALILTTLINHPFLLDEMSEDLSTLGFTNALLGAMRDNLLGLHAQHSPLDSSAITTHLSASGHNDALGLIARAMTHKSDRFTETGASEDRVRMGLRDALAEQEKAILKAALNAHDLQQALSEGSEAAYAQLLDLEARLRAVDARATGSDLPTAGEAVTAALATMLIPASDADASSADFGDYAG